MPDDFIDGIRKEDAIKAARQRAIDPSPRRSAPRRATNSAAKGGYAQGALRKACEAIETATKRNNTTNQELFNLGQLIAAGELDEQTVRYEIGNAARRSGLPDREIRLLLRDDETGGISAGIKSGPRDMEKVAAQRIPAEAAKRPTKAAPPDDSGSGDRTITWVRASSIRTRVPQWVWEHENVGRIQLGTLCMFAGKPAAGKSTASRWFAARLSRGQLPGVWEGTPMTVAMVSIEEQEDTTVVPSLQVAGADMSRIVLPRFTEAGNESVFASIRDEQEFTDGLLEYNVRAVFVDPVMSTFGGKADVYRNNEVRQYLAPFTRIAQAINGIVVCVHHLRKGTVQDVLGSMNGSSAFGEVPRGVFGFAPFEGGAHVMEQVKNSAGPTGLKLEYFLPIEYTQDQDGVPFELPKFEIKGTTTVSISDIDESRDELSGIAFTAEWLVDYLMENQPMPVSIIQRDAKAAGVVNNDKMLSRASKRVGVVSRSQPVKDKPNQHVWMLPEFAKGYKKW
jgi:hypothetical protein